MAQTSLLQPSALLVLDRPAGLSRQPTASPLSKPLLDAQGCAVQLQQTSCIKQRTRAQAHRGRQEDYDYVELDDEWDKPSLNLDYLPLSGDGILRTLQNFTNRFVDVVYDLAPAGTSRSVVDTTAKGAVLLVTIAFASSILSFLLNAGFVVLGLYVATKVLGINVSGLLNSNQNGSSPGRPQNRRGNQTRKARTSGQQRGRDGAFKTGLGQAAGDLTDVWFERKPNKQKPNR